MEGFVGMEQLPEELIECIMLHLTPYGDLQNCMAVSSRWYRLAKGTMYRLRRAFERCDRFDWYLLHTVDGGRPAAPPPIAERCSHAAAYVPASDAMFVFGGCTAAYTSFNDLWKFDLARRTWCRLVPQGTYPTPKACASFVHYDGRLVLFGGWAKSSPNPIHQTAMFFNELHVYDPVKNFWAELPVEGDSPHLAGHSAVVLPDKSQMLVFGGSFGNASSNHVWLLDLRRCQWTQVNTSSPRPAPRYGHSMARLDNGNVLVVGGCGGPNMIFNDAWLLTMPDAADADAPWQWTLLQSENSELAAPQLWSHAACQVGDKLVTLSRPPNSPAAHRRYMSSSAPRLAPDARAGARAGGRADEASLSRRSEFVPPQGNLIPPRRKLLTSRSLDEHVPPGAGQRSGSDSAHDSAACRAARAHADTIHRARSIPAIIVGEIPKLVVTNEAADDGAEGGPSGLQRPAPIAMSESSLLPNQPPLSTQAVPVSSAPPSPCIPSGQHRALVRPVRPSIRPNASSDRAKQLEMLARMEEHIRRQRSAASSGTSDGRSAPNSADSSPRFRPRSPPPAKSHSSADSPPQQQHAQQQAASGSGAPAQQQSRQQQQQSQSQPCAARRQSDSARAPMAMYVLETGDALLPHRRAVRWRVVQSPRDAPSDTILYSLVAARGELVLFGGMRSAVGDQHSAGLDVTPFTHTITNETYILRPVVGTAAE